MSNSSDKFVNYEDATEMVGSIGDKRVRAFVQNGLTKAITSPLVSNAGPVDLLYLCRLLESMASQETLNTIVGGDLAELGWFDDP